MSNYRIVVEKIDPHRHFGLRYEITISNDRGYVDTGWTYSKIGARREAKKMAKRHSRGKEVKTVVGEFEL